MKDSRILYGYIEKQLKYLHFGVHLKDARVRDVMNLAVKLFNCHSHFEIVDGRQIQYNYDPESLSDFLLGINNKLFINLTQYDGYLHSHDLCPWNRSIHVCKITTFKNRSTVSFYTNHCVKCCYNTEVTKRVK